MRPCNEPSTPDLRCSGRYRTRARSQPLLITADRCARFTWLCQVVYDMGQIEFSLPGWTPQLQTDRIQSSALLSYYFKPRPFSLKRGDPNYSFFPVVLLPALCVHSSCAFVQTHGPPYLKKSIQSSLKWTQTSFSPLFFSEEVTCWTRFMMTQEDTCLSDLPHSVSPLSLV